MGFFPGAPLEFVMNTKEEIEQTLRELQQGNFAVR